VLNEIIRTEIEMNSVAGRAVIPAARSPLLGVADKALAQRLTLEVERIAKINRVVCVSALADLLQWARRIAPEVILLDYALLEGTPLKEFLRQLNAGTAMVLLAPPECQTEVARLVAGGDVEFVARAGDFVPLAASLVERRLRWAAMSESALGPPWAELPGDVGAIFRHEINNPLTGILGNAELLLAHPDRLSAPDARRLQTVVDLAVRLRETIRRLSNAWEHSQRNLKSA
jgi:signal transduction histidine kinase